MVLRMCSIVVVEVGVNIQWNGVVRLGWCVVREGCL